MKKFSIFCLINSQASKLKWCVFQTMSLKNFESNFFKLRKNVFRENALFLNVNFEAIILQKVTALHPGVNNEILASLTQNPVSTSHHQH